MPWHAFLPIGFKSIVKFNREREKKNSGLEDIMFPVRVMKIGALRKDNTATTKWRNREWEHIP